jgi:protein-disulfide isomerase
MENESASNDVMENELNSDDVIVIKKAWLTTAAVALVFLVVGGLAGFFLGVFAYGRGFAEGNTAIAEVGAPAQPAQAPAQQPAAPAPRLDDVSIDDDPILGETDAPIVIVEFSDFECPFCARFREQTFDQIVTEYGDDVQIIYRDFPLSQIHPRAQQSAEASECADDQDAYWAYHDLLFANQQALDTESLIGYAEELGLDVEEFTECVESGKYTDEVLADYNEGLSYGVSGTPTFFINGVRLVGAQPFEAFQQIIEEELNS